MIFTVTLNPAIDKTLSLERLNRGEVNRLKTSCSHEGGKGINVSKVLKNLGISTTATGFLGGDSGDFISNRLQCLGILPEFYAIQGETRTNIKLTETDGTTTDLNEPGPTLDAEDCRRFQTKLRELTSSGDTVVFAGSLPRGVSSDYYAQLISDCRGKGLISLLDSSGDALIQAVEAKPFFIKPNLEEFSQLTGRQFETVSEICKGAEQILKKGISQVAVTLGSDGAVFASDDGFFFAQSVPVKVRCTVGSGDAFTAGYLFGRECKKSIPETLQIAIGAGSANAAESGTEPPKAENIFRLASQVQVVKI